jgi:hypothetical protein
MKDKNTVRLEDLKWHDESNKFENYNVDNSKIML